MRASMWLLALLCTSSCAYFVGIGGSKPPEGSLRVEVGGPDSSGSGTCEFSVAPPEGNEWRMSLSKWGPVTVELRFSRLRDKVRLRRTENIVVSTVTDTALSDTAEIDEEWLRDLVGDAYGGLNVHDLKLTPETLDHVILQGRECRVVRFSVSYRMLTTGKPTFERVIAYLTRPPCHNWRGWVVFRLVDWSCGSEPDDTFPSPEGSASLMAMIHSLAPGGAGAKSEP